jgi:hypothetical protein
MRIRLSERLSPRSEWAIRFDERIGTDETKTANLPQTTENSEFTLSIVPEAEDSDSGIELRIGKVLVASTRASDRTDFPILPAGSDDGSRRWTCSGQLLRDWVGVTDIALDVVNGQQRRTVLRIDDVRVAAGKVTQEVFEALCAEITAQSSALLLDVFGKTYFGLEPEFQPGESAPLAVMRRLRFVVDRMTAALRDIARRPALRLRGLAIREPALSGQSVNELTLEEACVDPTLATRVGHAIVFREQIREDAIRHFDLPEHRVLTGFLRFLRLQIADLRARAVREREQRRANRVYRDRPREDGRSWWQSEDEPRIRELEAVLETLAILDAELVHHLRLSFLPSAATLEEVPRITPLFRSHRAYADAFRTIVGHFQSYRVQIDGGHVLARARSLPALYECWCYLEVMRILKTSLTMVGATGDDSPFRRVAAERERFVIEFSSDQWIDFQDRTGRLVRLRYVPRYRNRFLDSGRGYGLLGPEPEVTPDLSLELYSSNRAEGAPELIVVLDAKYSNSPHVQILDRVRAKYGRIGSFSDGVIRSRQVWALAPTAPQSSQYLTPQWANSCTIDNLSFWSDSFDDSTPVAGVVQARPLLGQPAPLELLLRWVLEREGVVLVGGASDRTQTAHVES